MIKYFLTIAVALPNIFFPVYLTGFVITLCVLVSSFDILEVQAIGLDSSLYSLTASAVYIPYHNTYSLSKGIVALNRMYNSLDISDPLKAYLDNNCKHLLSPLQGSTDIPVEYINPVYLAELPSLNLSQIIPLVNSSR